MRQPRGVALSGLLIAALTVGCSASGENEEPPASPDTSSTVVDEGAPADADVLLTFDDLSPTSDLGAEQNRGTGSVRVDGRTFSGAMLTLEVDREGGQAVRFPSVSASPAVVTMTSTGGQDLFSPGSEDFTFGADVQLDPEATDAEQGKLAGQDNGNNVLQRGLFNGPAQFKVQVDKGRSSCRLRGEVGEVLVKAETPLPADTWARLTCTREGDQVLLTQEVLEGPDAGQVETSSGERPIGAITFGADAPPVALGGKVNAQGEPVRGNSDQFNGSIDNAFYDLLD